jgi:Protein of unknown function (DUF2585)
MGITRKHWIGIAFIFAIAIAILFAMQRPPICTCGTVKLWEGVVNGPGNSQHIADWYTFSHITHGFLFFGLTHWLMRRRPLGLKAMAASILELAWEVLENSPTVIDRYRQATMAVGYSGDSILNSVADGGWMLLGFLVASRLPWKVTLSIGVAFELFTLFMIRDNLTLNIVMLAYPLDTIRAWQGGL